jgi:hypothetical protein
MHILILLTALISTQLSAMNSSVSTTLTHAHPQGNELTSFLALAEDHSCNTVNNQTACRILINHARKEFEEGNLHLLDGIIGDNQCHLNALHIVELAQSHSQGALDLRVWLDDGTMNPVMKFLALNLFHNSVSKQKKVVLRDRILTSKKTILPFLENPIIREKSRKELSLLTMQWIKDACDQLKKTLPLAHELSTLTQNLTRDENDLFVFPKFAGIELFLNLLQRAQIPLIFKVKTLTAQGTWHNVFGVAQDGTIVPAQLGDHPDVPVIVAEGITLASGAMHNTLPLESFRDFIEVRKACPQNLFHSGKQQQHASCKACADDGALLRHPLLGMQAARVLRAISASFMEALQPWASELMSTCKLLQASCNEHLVHAKSMGLCTEHPHTFFIEHMLPSMHNAAVMSKRLLDQKPEEVMKALQK